MPARVFIGQPVLDDWISRDVVEVSGEILKLRAAGRTLKLQPGVHFVKVSGDGPDPHALVGKVKDQAGVAALGAEQYMNSVILGETAYDVVPGFVAAPADEARDGGEGLRAALQAAGGPA